MHQRCGTIHRPHLLGQDEDRSVPERSPERSQSVPERSERAAVSETSSRAARSQRFSMYPHP
eukprot:8985735-Pyramimonas_sp.AAC.1